MYWTMLLKTPMYLQKLLVKMIFSLRTLRSYSVFLFIFNFHAMFTSWILSLNSMKQRFDMDLPKLISGGLLIQPSMIVRMTEEEANYWDDYYTKNPPVPGPN